MDPGRAPLVGRDDLVDAARRAFTTDRTSAVVVGPPGAGLTRLAEELGEALAETAGSAVTSLRVTRAAATVPLGPLAPLLAADHDAPLSDAPDPDRPVDLAAALATIAAGGHEARRIVVVDEAHLLDDPSAAVLHQAAVAGLLAVVAVLGVGARRPDALVRLAHDGVASRVDVEPLSRADARALLAALPDLTLDPATTEAVLDAAGGYPRELVALAHHAATGQPLDGLQPPGLVERARADLDALPDATASALATVAVGEPLAVEVTRRAIGIDRLDELERRGALRRLDVDGTAEITTPTPARGRALRAAIGHERARSIAAGLVEELARPRPPARPRDRLRLVRLQLEVDGEPDLAALVDAATTAHFAHDVEVAETIARVARDRGAGYPASSLLGEVYVAAGRPCDAESVLAEAMAEARSDEELAIATMNRAVNLFYGGLEPDLAVRIVADVEGTVTSPWAEELRGLRAAFLLFAGDPTGAYEAVRTLLDGPATGRPFVEAAMVAAPALALAGRTAEAVAIATRGFQAREALGDHPVLADSVIHLAGHGIAACFAGDVPGARAVVETGTALARERAAATRPWMALTGGLLAQLEGAVGRAASDYARAAAGFAETSQGAPQRWALGGVAMTEAARGRAAAADAAVAAIAELERGPVRMLETEPIRGRAWTAVAHGRSTAAIDELERARVLANETGQHACEVDVLHDLVRLGRARPVAGRLAELAAGPVDGVLVVARARHARSLARRDATGLTDVAEEFTTLGARLFAAEAHAQAAVVHDRAGRSQAAVAARRRSEAERLWCDGATTPALRARGEIAALSEREREVARLAAAGAPSKAIAADLGVSVRTVDNLLQRAYRKLGISSRADLADALAEPAVPATPTIDA